MISTTMQNLEELRQANILRNKERLQELGIFQQRPSARTGRQPLTVKPNPAKKRKINPVSAAPSRVSARIAAAPARPSDAELNEEEANESRPSSRKKAVSSKGRKSITNDKTPSNASAAPSSPPQGSSDVDAMQAGWSSWKPTGPRPERDDDWAFVFTDAPYFRPNKSPEEMLREGVFGGSYFRPLFSRALGITVKDDFKELPKSWYSGLDVTTFLTSPSYDPEVNKFKVKCGQSIEEWEAAGWISHEHDVRGWFQWYCRFFLGRRCDDDERQIGRWQRCVGENGRWRRSLLRKYAAMGVKEVFDDGEDEEKGDVSPVQHQTCFHWAYELRQNDLDRFWATGQ